MNTDSARADEMLTRAFSGFEEAARRLRQRHECLQREVQRLERRLLDAHRRLEAVVDALDSGIAVLSADGRVLRANRAFEQLGFSAPGGGEELRALLGGEVTRRGSTMKVDRVGAAGPRELAVTLLPVGDDEGTLVLTAHDVTEIRREEEEGGRRRRLEALGRMAAELAHEVRNPLGSIRLLAGLLHDDLVGRASEREMAEQILAASSSLEAVVTNLLTFAAPPRHASQRLDLARLAAETCAMLAHSCQARGVALEGPGAVACETRADPEALRQVVLNLVGNALAATGRGGRIDVRAFREGDRAVLLVEDDGAGIAPEDLPRVFDPFFTRSEGGTGLGLSVVHQIVERHAGRIRLDSAPGRGTRARVEIPADPGTEGSR